MGVPLLFTDASGTPTLIVVPYPGLFLSDELFLGDGVFLDDGPTLDFYATAPVVGAFGVTVSVDPEPVTFSGAEAILPTAGQQVVAVVPWPVLFRGADIATEGLPIVVASIPVPVVFGAEVPATSGGQLLILIPSIRELPPLRLTHHLVTPSGRHFRWAPDDPNPTLVPSGERFGDTMPGGFETADCVLPRKPGTDYSDVERLSTWQILGAGGEVAWEGRLERAPRVSGDQMSVSPSAVGYQAALEDDKSAVAIYRDIDLTRWGSMSVQRRLNITGAVPPYSAFDANTEPDATNGEPALKTALTDNWGSRAASSALYDAGRARVGRVAYRWKIGPQLAAHNANPTFWNLWAWVVRGADADTMLVGAEETANLRALGPGAGLLAFLSPKRFVEVVVAYGGANTDPVNAGLEFPVYWTSLAVYGDHGLQVYGTEPTAGLLASDVVAHAVRRWAPQLSVTTGTNGSVRPSSFVIPHLVFPDATTAAEIVRGATRFGLEDWAVWDGQDGPTFHWHQRGAEGRKWRARVNPAQLEETGPQLDRLWESVIVQYQDVDGSSKTVGPPGSGADWEDSALKDPDPENPANEAGIIRRALLTMGTSAHDPLTGRPAAPIQIGSRFLQEQKLLDRSGRARLVGHVEDDRGVLHPYWKVRAGDYITFVDSNDTSYRRIVKTDKDHASRTCSVDLDAPPEGLQALLERFGVGITDLGFS